MSDEEGCSRLRKLAEGYEDRFYNEATNKVCLASAGPEFLEARGETKI
jgi:hypothetical protein